MFEDARSIWPDFSTSSQQIDPVVQMMFKAVANRLKEVNDKICDISETIINDLACRIFFDGLLHPIPSSTILKFSTGSSVTSIDILTEACWVNTSIQPSVTFYFSPCERKDLYPTEAVFALLINDDEARILWTSPDWDRRAELMGHIETIKTSVKSTGKDYVYIGLRPMGKDHEVARSDIYIQASSDLLEYLRWSRWRFTQSDSVFGDPVVPGRERLKKTWSKKAIPELSLWGHNYYPFEHKEEYQEYFFDIEQGVAGGTPSQLTDILSGVSSELLDNLGPLYWIQIESDKRIPTEGFNSFKLAATNCVVGLNAHYLKQSCFYHGPGPMEINPQNTADEIFEIVSLDDNHGRSYSNIYMSARNDQNQYHYVPRIDGNIFKVIVIPPDAERVPDRFSLSYRISSGEMANGIEAGIIDSLYNPHPGIESVINITTTKGGTSAGSFNDMIKAFPSVLQSSNRAVVPSDFESLAISFDRRIVSVKARPGSIERDGILRGCIGVDVNMGGYSFKLAEEESLFLSRLAKFLEMRSPIGTVVTARFSE